MLDSVAHTHNQAADLLKTLVDGVIELEQKPDE
jgi:hypothetical protein